MTVKMKMLTIYFIEFVIILPRIITSEEVDPVDFLLSKNSPKNRTISLPKLFKYTGNQTQGDCCALALFFEVKDLPIPDYGSGMEPPQIDQNEEPTETGQVTFTFLHPQIRNNPYTFTTDVKDVEEKVTTRDQIDFDNCKGINKMTIDIYAKTTIMDEKDVRIVMITGKDEGLSCKPKPTPNPSTPKALQVSSVVPALIISWSITLLVLAICGFMCYKYKKLQYAYQQVSNCPNIAMDEIQSQKEDSQNARSGIVDDKRGMRENEDLAPNKMESTEDEFQSHEDGSQIEIAGIRHDGGGTKEDDGISKETKENTRGVDNIIKGGKPRNTRGKPRGPPKGVETLGLS